MSNHSAKSCLLTCNETPLNILPIYVRGTGFNCISVTFNQAGIPLAKSLNFKPSSPLIQSIAPSANLLASSVPITPSLSPSNSPAKPLCMGGATSVGSRMTRAKPKSIRNCRSRRGVTQ